MESDLVTVAIENGIASVKLNRPDKINALDYAMFKAIDNTIKSLAKQRDIAVIILSGSHGNFSSGLDVKGISSSPSGIIKLLFKWLPGNANLAQRVSLGWQRLPIPVIAVIEGCCYGGGTQVALGADFRIAAPDAKMSIMEARWGLLPDMAGLAGLRQIMPKDQAMRLSLLAEVIDAPKAKTLGLVTEVVDDPHAYALDFALQIANTSPDANAAIKLSINYSWSGSIRRLLSRESLSQVKILLGKNWKIAATRQTKNPQKPYQSRQSGW
ncbi:crotonase/enoyl-CoA hydratase family protein [Shewanella intestini]|uniref:Crotonase/enoyl-CoA hydratase family protein n=1 Tax=Shewanella intestini TaxID=2017544 RepID=A0ABS5I102_9GAMM|nr:MULTISPECIES: crotonase/enoyl-CoA hydratase family protein [Shewanella]MBR9727596.1 crotonase/enoyl-CoA hydratase family protein [Shewanella intestini]MRG35254.1 crotonase/enoyl-CoA hydratase family protein [Shewanella sp. XMDDZSB0408]